MGHERRVPVPLSAGRPDPSVRDALSQFSRILLSTLAHLAPA